MALNPVSIPLIITKDQKQQLLDLGYKKAQINKMKPEEAHKILGIESQTDSVPVLAETPLEIPGKFLPPQDEIEIPQHAEAEKALLGALLFNQSKNLWESVMIEIFPGHLFLESHKKIYQAMLNLFQAGELPNSVTVIEELRRLKQLKNVGGPAFISELVNSQYRRESLAGEIRSIRSTYRRRYIINLSQRMMKRALSGEEDGDIIVDDARIEIAGLGKTSTSRIEAICMTDVKAEKLEWLWKDRIPMKGFTLMQGIEGIGKSTLLCALAAAITGGPPVPDLEISEPGNILWFSAEDDLGQVLKPRLEAAGADCSRVFAVDRPFSLDSKGILLLREQIGKREYKLVIIDPLYAYIKGSANDGETARMVTNEFKIINDELGSPILASRHLNKSKGFGDSRAAGSGSNEWQAAARSVLLVGYDPDDKSKLAIIPTKHNNSAEAKGLGYAIRSDITSPSGARFFWTGISDLTAKRILAPISQEGDDDKIESKNQIEEATEFVLGMLSEGRVLSKTMESEAKAAGITWTTLNRAKHLIGVRSVPEQNGKGKVYFWELNGKNGHHQSQIKLGFEAPKPEELDPK